MHIFNSCDRRGFLKANTALLAAVPLGLFGGASAGAKAAEKEIELTPLEDLMQEHGLVRRILLICREGQARLERNEGLPPSLFAETAAVMRSVVENHHEPAEEEFVFSRLTKAGRLVDLVGILKGQHQASRRVTDRILSLSGKESLEKDDLRKEMIQLVSAMARMYEHHAVWEDTVVFPEFRRIVSDTEYEKIGDLMEEREHEQLGEHGIGEAVKQIAALEKSSAWMTWPSSQP